MNVLRVGFILMLVGAISSGTLSYVYFQTKPIIEQRKVEDTKRVLLEVLPSAKSFKELNNSEFKPLDDSIMTITNIYLGIGSQDDPVGVAIKGVTVGYGGSIVILIGISNDNKIAGIEIIEHKETPGLGSKIAEKSFTGMFVSKTLNNPLTIKKDLTAIAGATKSSQAVAKLVKKVAEYVLKNREAWR